MLVVAVSSDVGDLLGGGGTTEGIESAGNRRNCPSGAFGVVDLFGDGLAMTTTAPLHVSAFPDTTTDLFWFRQSMSIFLEQRFSHPATMTKKANHG
jgi:hypothetical protein